MRTWNKKKKRQKISQAIKVSFYFLLMLFAISVVSVLTGCKATQRSVDASTDSYVYEKETLEPFAVPADSLTLRALFECDSLNNVLFRGISESKSKNMSSVFSFDKGVLSYDARTHPDTVWVKQKEKVTLLKQTVTIKTTVTKTVLKRDAFWWSGLVLWISLTGFVVYKLSRKFRVFFFKIITFIK